MLVAVLPLFVLSDRGDVGTEHAHALQTRPRPPRLVVFDRAPGGNGVSGALYDAAPAVLRAARALVRDCACEDGCPGCVHDLRCPEFNSVVDKRAALMILDDLVARLDAADGAAAAAAQATGAATKKKPNTPERARQKALMRAKRMEGQQRKRVQGSWAEHTPNYSESVDHDDDA